MEDQFAAEPASTSTSAEADATIRRTELSQDESFSSTRSVEQVNPPNTASIPAVSIDQETIHHHTCRVRQAQELPYNQPYGEFLLELKNHVDSFEEPVDSLYLEPVLILDRTTNEYIVDVAVCTEHIYRVIQKLLDYHGKWDLFSMNRQKFITFYSKYMKTFKTTPLKAAPKPAAKVVPKPAAPKPAAKAAPAPKSQQAVAAAELTNTATDPDAATNDTETQN